MRVALFIDGKSFHAGWRSVTGAQKIDFNLLSRWLVNEANADILFGAFYYTSVDSSVDDDAARSLQGFLSMLDNVPGFFVKKVGTKYTRNTCLSCGIDNPHTSDKALDTTITADMVRLAANDSFDIAILSSGNGNLAPATKALREMGKIVHVAFWGNTGLSGDLRKHCHTVIDLTEALEECQTNQGQKIEFDPDLEADEFIHELERAQNHFKENFVGLSYFLNKWHAKKLTSDPLKRRDILDTLITEEEVEIYITEEGKQAIRLTAIEETAA